MGAGLIGVAWLSIEFGTASEQTDVVRLLVENQEWTLAALVVVPILLGVGLDSVMRYQRR